MGIADRCVIATDSEEIVAAALEQGAQAIMTRDDHLSGTDRVAEVAARSEFRTFDVIVNVQGDEPFVCRQAIAGAAQIVVEGRFPLATASAPAPPEALERPSVVKVVCADDGRALYFSRAAIPHLREKHDAALRDARVRQHIGVYAYRRDALARWVALPEHDLERIERLEQLRPLAAGMAMGVAAISDFAPPGVDTEEDLALANARWPDFIARENGHT
jgi:3-deoxy-manno-octulosonate cytidylyltransferase (CMP-KDO synthetase)